VDKFIPYRHEVADKLNDPMNAFTKKWWKYQKLFF
jgi:hypothetical protein